MYFSFNQVLRSVCGWSAGIANVENSIHMAYEHCIENAKEFIYIEVNGNLIHVYIAWYIYMNLIVSQLIFLSVYVHFLAFEMLFWLPVIIKCCDLDIL